MDHIWVQWKERAIQKSQEEAIRLDHPKELKQKRYIDHVRNAFARATPTAPARPAPRLHRDPCRTAGKQSWFDDLQPRTACKATCSFHLRHTPSPSYAQLPNTKIESHKILEPLGWTSFLTQENLSLLALGFVFVFFFLNREKNKCQSVKCKDNLKRFCLFNC